MFRMSFRLALLVVSLGALLAQSALAQERPILEASTETPTPGAIMPWPGLLRVVLDAIGKEDIEQLDECIAEQELRRADYAPWLRAVEINAGGGRTLWFVRPALRPYCHALYGAHLFRYLWIEEQASAQGPLFRVLFQNGGDEFAVYAQQNHGVNDIEPTGCNAIECRSARMSFDGETYRAARCFITTFDNGKSVKKERVCKGDGWDDQSSGLAPKD